MTPTDTWALLGTVLHFSCCLCPSSIPCVTDERCNRTHLALEETQPMCLAISKCGERPWQGQYVAAHVSVPPEPNPLPKQELGFQEEIWLKAFEGLCCPCPARADSFLPWEAPSPSPSDACRGSKLLLPTPAPAAGTPVGTAAIPWGGGHPSRRWHRYLVTPAGRPGSGTTGTAGACAQEGGELTGLIFSRLRSALTCDPRYRKDAANVSSPGAGWLDLVGRGKSTSRLFRPAGVSSNSNLISP